MITAKQPLPWWIHFAISILLLGNVIYLDIYTPFNRPWSNLYFLVSAYVGLFLRGRVEVLLYVCITLSVIMVPTRFRSEVVALGPGFSNRIAGVIAGFVMTGLIWVRRRYVAALQTANDELERKVVARTAELQTANESLRHEITERQQADGELRTSRQRLEVLSRQLISTQETERRHLARELHDEIGQVLTAIKMNLRRTQRAADASLQSNLEENVEMVDQAIIQVRNLSLSLRPPQLDELGLTAALHWLVKQQAQSVEFEIRLDVDLGNDEISSDVQTVCFRIAQEALTNAVRHAKPSNLQLKLWANDNQLNLSVLDDGIGFDVGEIRLSSLRGESVGLISMQERATLIGGQFEIESTPNLGTRIHARFPLSSIRAYPALSSVGIAAA